MFYYESKPTINHVYSALAPGCPVEPPNPQPIRPGGCPCEFFGHGSAYPAVRFSGINQLSRSGACRPIKEIRGRRKDSEGGYRPSLCGALNTSKKIAIMALDFSDVRYLAAPGFPRWLRRGCAVVSRYELRAPRGRWSSCLDI